MLISGSAAAMPAGALSAWKEYARRSLAPDYAWSTLPAAVAPNALDAHRGQLRQPATLGLHAATHPRLRMELHQDSVSVPAAGSTTQLLGHAGSAFTAAYASTSLVHSFGPRSEVALTAIIARNRFATPGLGASPWQAVEQFTGVRTSGVQEISEGGGVRLSLLRGLNDGVAWSLALQSRLDMDAFKAYRGIYSEAGDFDVPGHVQTGLSWSLSPRLTLGADVQYVFYGEIDTFTSAALPTRFLSLLGDGSSPEFAWRDLTVYSAQATVSDDFGGHWTLRYSTRQQPQPTSAILSRALEEQYSNLNLALAYRRDFGAFGSLQVGAGYAPAGYFLAPSPFVQHNFDGGALFEVEAQWSIAF